MLKKLVCPLDCFDTCCIDAYIEDGKIKKLYGSKDHPITNGFLCPKGYKLIDKIYSSERIKKPLLRIKNDFHEISWDQALDIIIENINWTIKNYNSSSILYYEGDGYEGYLKNIERLFFDYLGGATYSQGSLCWGAGLFAQKLDFGNSLSHYFKDLFNAKTIVIWGRNVAWTNLHLFYFVKKAKRMGIKIVVIDVYNTETSKIADLFIKIKPTSDSYLAYGIIKYLIENNQYDKEFVEEYSIGFDKIKSIVQSINFEEIIDICGIKKEHFFELANIYASKPVCTFIGYGPQRYKNGVSTVRSIDYLVAISGNVGISGGGANYANRYTLKINNIFENKEKAINKRFFIKSKFGEYLRDQDNPPINFVYISGANPISQAPDSDLLIRELRKRFVVCIDMFLTVTALSSTVILPVASFAEKDDIFITNMWHDYIAINQKAIEPLYDSKSEVEIINLLANRLKLPDFPIYNEREWVDKVKREFEKRLNISFNDNHFIRGSKVDIPWQDKKFETPSKKFEFDNNFGVAYPNCEEKNKGFRIISIHSNKSLHSQSFINVEQPFIFINPKDAKKAKIENMDRVMIYNQYGSFICTVKFDNSVPFNCLIVEEGYQNDHFDVLNSVMGPLTSEFDKQAAYNSNYVFIKKVI